MAANDDSGDKTEDPTERRRSEAREKGNVAKSSDLTAAGLMLAVAATLALMAIPTIRFLAEMMHSRLAGPAWINIDSGLALSQFDGILRMVAVGILPVMLAMAGAAIFFNVVQIGFMLSTEVLQPKISRLNPLDGIKRIVSIRALVKLAVSLGKLVLVASIAGFFIWSMLPAFVHLNTASPATIILAIEQSLVKLAFQLALALILLALLDFAFQKWKHEQDLKMSKQEIREEMKNMEGDPLIKQRRREAHLKISQAREMRAVSDADVVITNPTHIAIALKYDPETMLAPSVVAKGKGELAARIRRIAAEAGVPIIERKQLARSLYENVKAGQQIPVDMYEVFVEIMAYVYNITGRTPSGVDAA